jgi:hypothetical protein
MDGHYDFFVVLKVFEKGVAAILAYEVEIVLLKDLDDLFWSIVIF